MSEQKTHVVELTEPQAEKIRAAFADVDRANRHASTLVAFALGILLLGETFRVESVLGWVAVGTSIGAMLISAAMLTRVSVR